MEILRPLLAETGAEPIGKVVIGTVKGDIHDIGKNLVAMMMEGAGFEVIDLGINTDVDKYLAALDEHQPDILGMSALLTTTMPYMKVVIDTLTEKGLRDKYIVLVGGAPLNEEFGSAVGADAYCRDAAVAAETAKELVQARRLRRPSRPARRWPDSCDPLRPAPPARDRLRRAGLRAAGGARNHGLDRRSRCATSRPTCTTDPSASCPPSSAARCCGDGRPAGVRRLRRLRHRRRSRRDARPASPASSGCPAPTATRSSPAPSCSPSCTTRSRARSS